MGEEVDSTISKIYGEIASKGYKLDFSKAKKMEEDLKIYVIPATNSHGDKFMVKIIGFDDDEHAFEHAERYRKLINDFRPLTRNPDNCLVRIVEDVEEPLSENSFEAWAYTIMDAGQCNLEEMIVSAYRERKEIPVDLCIKAGIQVATALRAVAEPPSNKVHRDVKPANIIVFPSREGYNFFLADFHTMNG